MAFNIGALLRDKLFPTLSGAALVGDPAPEPAGGVLPAPPAPPIGAAGGGPALPLPPEGVPEAAPPPPPVPEAYKSPPDLVEMYSKLMDKSRNAAAMDRGMTLIAAGFAQPQNREALIRAAYSGGSGGGGSSPSMSDILALQKYQTEQADVAARRAQLPMLMEKYKLDEATVKYLDATGQLDETIVKLADPETQVVEGSDGNKKLIDINTGETIKELSPAKPRPTEYVTTSTGSKILVYSDTKEDVTTGEVVSFLGAPEKPITTEKLADGRIQAIQDGKPVGDPFGPEETTIVELADGTQQPIVNGKPVGKPFGPKENVSTDDIKEWTTINEQRKTAGKPEISLEDWIISRTKAGTEAGNQGATGINYGDPPKGQAWKRDKAGTVVVDEDGAPVSVWIKNSPEYAAYQKTLADTKKSEQEAADAAAEATKLAEGQAEGDVRKDVGISIVDNSIKESIDLIEKGEKEGWLVGNTGFGAYLSGIKGTEPYTLARSLDTVKANIGFDKLQAMRAESKTGAALGPVSDYENKLLQGVMGSLEQGLPAPELRRNLMRVNEATKLIAYGVEDPPGSGKYRRAEQADVDKIIGGIQATEIGSEENPEASSIEEAVKSGKKLPGGISVEEYKE